MGSRVGNHATTASTARDREFYRYYNPEGFDRVSSTQAVSSHDTALTAFAQLGALRLNVKRCMISLFDSDQQYIISEATRTLSLQSDSVHDRQDELILGTTTIPRESGVCKLVVELPDKDQSLSDADAKNVVIIPDLMKDERLQPTPSLRGKPFGRFYAGAPIRSPKGYHIGCYCVYDDEPRSSITDSEIQFLRDMAITVMGYLECARAREENRRGERRVRGLGSFHEGKSTLRNWRPAGGSPGNEERSYEPSRATRGGEGQLNQQQQDLQIAGDLNQEPGDSLVRLTEGAGNSYNTNKSAHAAGKKDTHAILHPIVEPSTDATSIANPIARPDLSKTSSYTLGLQHDAQFDDQKIPENLSLQEDMLALGVKGTFSRASNIIRESIEVEGSIFVDASISSAGGLVDQKGDTSDSNYSTPITSSGSDVDTKSMTSSKGPSIERMCGVLGFATSHTSSINHHLVSNMHGLVPEGLVKGLLKRYPKGKIFHFDEDGQASSGSSSEASADSHGFVHVGSEERPVSKARARRRLVRRFSRRTDAEEMIKIFPGARSIAVTPVWDSHRSRWFSLGVVWTNNPRRVLTVEGDLSYLASFANTIMAEVARLDALTAEKAKTDLLGSISHELRSPLHGILGSVELLEDSITSSMQANLVNSIETCGRTLLDTIDHLLDYTKINHSSQLARQERNLERDSYADGVATKTNKEVTSQSATDVDICALAEEVMSAVSAGYDMHRLANSRAGSASRFRPLDSSYADDTSGDAGQVNSSSHLNDVAVSIDVAAASNWVYHTQAGAWRRIVMNLFSNSLKYTDHGFIHVSLRSEPLAVKHGLERSRVILNVTDSGRGISKDYLKERLFTPFAQEDQLAPGTGLGLSIIQQIIKNLGGKISVKSNNNRSGHGTDVCVSIPMTHAQSGQGLQYLDSDILPRTTGLDVAFLGVESHPANGYESPAAVDYEMTALKSMCKTWFKMHCRSDVWSPIIPDLYIIVENELNHTSLRTGQLFERLQQKALLVGNKRQLQAIVICRTPSTTNMLEQSSGRPDGHKIVEFLCQPCGPRQLGKALLRCFRRSSELKSKPSLPQEQGYPSPAAESDVVRVADEDVKAPEESVYFLPSPSPEVEQQASSFFPRRPSISLPSYNAGPYLLVDDNHINIQVLKMYMSKNKFIYATAGDGLEALDVYKAGAFNTPFRTVFMDISMPKMDGLTSTRHIRAFEDENKLPPASIIMLTGLGSASVQQEAYSSGANLLLTKPVRLKELSKILEEIQDRSERPVPTT